MSVELEFREDVAVITLDDGNKNVINHGVLDQLEAAWDRAEAEANAVILAGRAGSFCAGYDISVMTGGDAKAAAELGRRGGRLAYRLFDSAKPLIGVSAGHAFTIGAVWLSCCDIRIGEQGRYKYGMTEVALNVGFGDWPLQPLKARLNPSEVIPALLHSKIYDPTAALNAGFIDQLVPEGQAIGAALGQAAELAKLPSEAYHTSKRSLRRDALGVMAGDLGL
ncbi:MAG: enoyl-CoA hydratase-related protein [Pseudomonadota bacterium]